MKILQHNGINIGIDTGQTKLDLFVRPLGHSLFFDNTPIGIKEAIKYINQFNITRVHIEATGRART